MGLKALKECLEVGYDEFATIRSDPDLEALRADSRFEVLLKQYEPMNPLGMIGNLFGRK